MNILPIVGYGSAILRCTATEAENNETSQLIIEQLLATAKSLKYAVGLAANQINSDKAIFVMNMAHRYEVVVNPKITKRRANYHAPEGCLSLPGMTTDSVIRDNIIDVEYFDKDFNRVKTTLRKFDSIVFQHEYDHLLGILYIDRMDDYKLEEVREKLASIEESKTKTYYDMIWPDKNVLLTKNS